MRQPFAHDAVITLAPDADIAAPGGAVTAELCGHWQHPPPSPLAPHHTHAERSGEHVVLRILFAAEPEQAPDIRSRIESALASGRFRGPDGVVTRWTLVGSGPGSVRADEVAHARRLVDE